MQNKLKISGIIVFLLLLATVNAQENFVSSSTIDSQFSDPSIKLSFRSWGENQITEIKLDDYFIGERSTDERYLYISPPEIEIFIDQETSIATLKARGKWLGTLDIIFTRSNLYNLEKSRKELKEFESELIKKRIPPKITNELKNIQDQTLQLYFERILDNLEKKKSKEIPQIDAKFEQNELTVNIGKDIDLSVGVETDILGTETRKPTLEVNVRPGEQLTEEEEILEEGLPIVLLFPLFLIGGTLLFVAGFFILKNPERLKKLIPTVKQTKPEIIDKDIDELLHYKKEIKDIENGINKLPLKATSEKIFTLIKNFFNNITHSDYEFTYSEVTKEILEEELSRPTKEFLIKFSKEIEDFRYSNRELTKSSLLDIIKKTQKGILLSIKDVSRLQTKEEIKLEKKEPFTHLWVNLRGYLSKDDGSIKKISLNLFKNLFKKERVTKREIEKLTEEKAKKKPFSFSNLLHKIGLVKTSEEKEKLRKQKALEETKEKRLEAHRKLLEEKEKLRILEEEKKEKIANKIARRKAIRKFFKDHFGLFKTAEDIKKEQEEKLKIRLEKEKLVREIERAKKLGKQRKIEARRRFFHAYFGLFKTKKEIELEVKTRLEEKKKAKIARRKAIIKFFNDNFGLFKTQKEILEEKRREEQSRIEKLKLKHKIAEEKRKAGLERKQAIRQFLHDNFGLLKTPEEKERIIKERFEAKRIISEERRKAIFSFIHDTLGIKTREEREQLKLKEGKLKLEVLKEKRKIRLERQKAVRKFFHDHFGLYKTQEEEEKTAIEKLRLKHERSKERRKAFIKFCHNKLGLFKTKREIDEEKEAKLKLKEKIEKEKEKAAAVRKASWKRFLHDRLGLLKTPQEIRVLNEQKAKGEARKEKLAKERELAKLIKRNERNKALREFLHDKLGFFKTKEELKFEHEKRIKLKLEKDRIKATRRKVFRNFLHDKLDLFMTQEERISKAKLREKEIIIKLREKEAKKIRRLELKNRIIEKGSFLRKIFSRNIQPADELHVLIKLEQEAIRKGEIKKAKEFQNKINKIYNKIEFNKAHPKIANEMNLIKTKIYTLRNKLNDPNEKDKSIFSRIKDIFSPQLEKNKIEEINYLINKCESALKSNKKRQAQEFYLRIIQLYKKLNRISKREVQHDILRLREEVASIAVEDALEDAHKALLEGKTKEAKRLYEKVKDNFYYLPLKEKENLIESKAELAQKLQQTKKPFFVTVPRIPLPEFDILTLVGLQKEKVLTKYNEIKKNILKPEPNEPRYKEPLKNYMLAEKPKFTSIKIDTIPQQYTERIKNRKIKELSSHLNKLNYFVEKKDHLKAKEKYKETVEFFKDHSQDLPEEMHNLVYTTLKPIKNRILQVSFKNLLSDMHKAVKEGEHELAKELKNKVNSIHSHLSENQMLPFAPQRTRFSELRELLRETNKHLESNNLSEAKTSYNKINNLYQQLTPPQKRLVYGKVLDVYRKLSP